VAAEDWGVDLNREEAATSRFPSCNPVSGLAPAPPYTPLMPRFVGVWERAGFMDSDEAAEWRERVQVWQRFRSGREPRPIAASPLLEDPSSFL
jgi:hypothetical protein